jgi:hypothetical protein
MSPCENCGKETTERFCSPECAERFEDRVAGYQEKLDSKRERLQDRAMKFKRISDSCYASAQHMSSYIPLGQPILVGHHSEKRHRRDLARINSNYDKAFESANYAKHLAARAANVGANGISSDDPEALAKLKEKLQGLENRRETMKAINKEARKAKAEKPYETWQLSNLAGNIRNVKLRIAQLEQELTRPEAQPIEVPGLTIEEDSVDNRLRLFFDGKPSAEFRHTLKSWGFRWSPRMGAWQRHLNNAARSAADVILKAWEKHAAEKLA